MSGHASSPFPSPKDSPIVDTLLVVGGRPDTVRKAKDLGLSLALTCRPD